MTRLDAGSGEAGSSVASGVGARTIILSANSSWNILNFRASLIRALIDSGHRVVVVAPQDSHSAAISGLGAAFVPMAMNGSGLSVREDLGLLLRYLRLFRE